MNALAALEDSLLLVMPDGNDRVLSLQKLGQCSEDLAGAVQMEEYDEDRVRALSAWAVAPGDKVQHARGEEAEQLVAGPHMQQLADGTFAAERYGYLHLQEGVLAVFSPLWIAECGVEARWFLLDEPSQPVTATMLEPWLVEAGIVEGVDYAAIGEAASEGALRGAVVIARGRAAVHGEDARLEILLDNARSVGSAGAVRKDGAVDSKQIDALVMVETEQAIARLWPATRGRAGCRVTGASLPARSGKGIVLKAGDHVKVQQQDGASLFVAAMSGAFRHEGDVLSVTRILRIEGDVDFHSGNLDFDGSVFVAGKIQQGFTVKATRDIAVEGSVEAGAALKCAGDIAVGGGIVGRRTRIFSGGGVRAQYVQEATVAAGGDIELEGYADQAHLRAGGSISVTGVKGARGGSVVGGQTWGCQRIAVRVAGAPLRPVTRLTAGVDPESARQLDKLKSAVDMTYTQLSRLLNRFSLSKVDVGQIKNRIAAAVGPRRKLLVNTARSLGKVVQAYQQLAAARVELEGKISMQVEDAVIEIGEQAYAGVEIRLGEHTRKLVEDCEGVSFRVTDGKMVC